VEEISEQVMEERERKRKEREIKRQRSIN